MRKFLIKIALYIALSCTIMILSLCTQLSDVNTFLKDDEVTEVVKNTKKGTVTIEVEFEIVDLVPELELDNGSVLQLKEGGKFTISSGKAAVITVTNANIFTSIEWYCGSTTPLKTGVITSKGWIFMASTENAPFTRPGLYMVTVIGKTAKNISYGTYFNVMVE